MSLSILRRHKDLDSFLLPEEELKPTDEIVEKYRSQKVRILEEHKGLVTRFFDLFDFVSDTRPINIRFGDHVAEYFRLRNAMRREYSNYLQTPVGDNKILVMALNVNLQREMTAINLLYSQALAKQLVDEGLGKQIEELKEKTIEYNSYLDKARLRIAKLETYMRIHGLNPDDANDTIVSEPREAENDSK